MSYERLTEHSAKGLKLREGKKYIELLADKELTKKALSRLAELEDKIENGKLIEPHCKVGDGEIVKLLKNKKKMFRILPNPRCNDFNDEPEDIVVPYTIIAESIDGAKYLVERNGWHGKKYQHWIKENEFLTKAEAEEKLRELRGEK